jgi:hypothetical protein
VEADPSGSGTYLLNEDSVYGLESPPVPPLATNFLEYIDDLPTWDRSLFQYIIRSILLSAYVSHQGNQSMKGTVVG